MELFNVVNRSTQAGNGDSQEGEFPYRRHSTVIRVFALVAIGGCCLIGPAAYVSGRINNPLLAFLVVWAFVPALGLAALAFFVWGLFLLFRELRAHRRVGLKLDFVLVPLLIGFVAFMMDLPAWSFLRGFKYWVSRNVDVAAIQEWLPAEGAKYAGNVYGRDFPSEFPKFLVEFKPKYIAFNPSAAGGIVVNFDWGGMVSWRLVVGPPTATTPEAVGIEPDNPHVKEVRGVKPGAYIVFFTG